MKKHTLPAITLLVVLFCLRAAGPSAAAIQGSGPFLWEADTSFVYADKAKIGPYLDDLKAHGINGVWLQVEMYRDGAVVYKKTSQSSLPTADKFKSGTWASEDYLTYVIAQARERGMSVMIKFHGSNDKAWDKNPAWRIRDSKGKEVLWSGKLKNFCVNSPYWDAIFFPMLREIGQGYDVDGFYLDTCQVAYPTSDTCFCQYCRDRFEKETGKKLPLKRVDRANWSDPDVKLHALKRTEWLNGFYERYRQAVEEAKPGASALLNMSGSYNSYKDGLSARHAGAYVTQVTPEPVNTPRMYSVVRNRQLKKEGKPEEDPLKLARDEISLLFNRYGYHEFLVKTMIGEGQGKPVIPFTRFWFTDDETMGPLDLEIAQMEAAIGAGARGYCFFGYLASAMEKKTANKSTWANPKYIEYLKDLTSGERAKWIADMQSDSRYAILYDRDADFWAGDYWTRLRSVGGAYGFLQIVKKHSVDIIPTSERDLPGMGRTGYKLDATKLARYQLVIAPGLEYVSAADLQTLRDYVEAGGHLLLMGCIGASGKFPEEGSTSDDAYRILGIKTEGEPTNSGYVIPLTKHPVFTAVVTPKETRFALARRGETAMGYWIRHDDGWEKLADELTSNGRRTCALTKPLGKGTIAYINSSEVAGFSYPMGQFLANMAVLTAGTGPAVMAARISHAASINVFKSADGMTRYINIFTLDGEKDMELTVRPEKGAFPLSAEILRMGGKPEKLPMNISTSGVARILLTKLEPYSATIKITYEKTKTDEK